MMTQPCTDQMQCCVCCLCKRDGTGAKSAKRAGLFLEFQQEDSLGQADKVILSPVHTGDSEFGDKLSPFSATIVAQFGDCRRKRRL